MLRTLSDTVTLNSNQLTLVSNEFLRRSNQGSAFLLLTQITANHTSKLRDLEDQVKLSSLPVDNIMMQLSAAYTVCGPILFT